MTSGSEAFYFLKKEKKKETNTLQKINTIQYNTIQYNTIQCNLLLQPNKLPINMDVLHEFQNIK